LRGKAMDFIERLFGVSPDGGDGSFEAALLGVIVVLLAAVVWRQRLGRLFRNRSPSE
jgi:hypothetical protein